MTEFEAQVRFAAYAEELREIQARVTVLVTFLKNSLDSTEADFMAATIGSAAEVGESLSRPRLAIDVNGQKDCERVSEP